jgi:hypothetical protein
MRSLEVLPTEADYLRLFELKEPWTLAELKISFLKLARKYHPDMNPGNNEADSFFKFLNHAYEILTKLAPSQNTSTPSRPETSPAKLADQKSPPAKAAHTPKDAKSNPEPASSKNPGHVQHEEKVDPELMNVLRACVESFEAKKAAEDAPKLSKLQKFRQWLNPKDSKKE